MSCRQVTPLLRRLYVGSHITSSSFTGLLGTGSSSSSCLTRKMIHFSQDGSRCSKGSYGGLLWMLLHGQAALLFGGSCSIVFAEDVPNGIASETNAGELTNDGLQRLEDGSVISNEHTSKWRIFTDNGRDFFLQGKMIEAEKLFSSALTEAKKGFGERDPHVASACNNLAELYRVQKSYHKAEPLYLDSISILEEAFGPDDVRVGAAFHNLGQFYIGQRKLEEARVCYERSLKIKGRVLGHGHSDYAETMFHLGTVLYLQGNAKDAEVLIQDSIRILEEGGQGESFSCIRKLRYLAKIYIKSNNKLGEAENVQRKILHIMELTKGWDSLDTVNAAGSLSMTLQSLGKLRDARELLERCLDVRRTLLPRDHIQIGANLLGLANLALLNVKQMKKLVTAEASLELDRAKEPLTNSVRIAQLVLDGSKSKQRYGRDEHTALLILEDLPVLEAEKSLRRCIGAYKQYGALISTYIPIEVKGEYSSCLKNLLSLITDTANNADQSCKVEVQELRDEIIRVEEEISSHKKHRL
ncbi:uncharacterized protein [Spinacia oleracea]|uniref:Uncharacterized protein isoform X2 n=1 Tax=Spinacia oleracea TaxID=3562 RepID=A0ABM3RE08_SPIOL|nr:uncharacterized protein LOC110794295 isoform X2 [Spinacia oleracea]